MSDISPRPSLSTDPGPVRLSGRRLLLCITVLGWSERHAAERCLMHRTSFRRCVEGTSSLDAELSAWLLALEAAIRALPCPRARLHDPAYRVRADIARDGLSRSSPSQAYASGA